MFREIGIVFVAPPEYSSAWLIKASEYNKLTTIADESLQRAQTSCGGAVHSRIQAARSADAKRRKRNRNGGAPMIVRNFVVFEGGDGSGTTTQIELLERRFEREKTNRTLPRLWTTREPTDGAIGVLIRSALRGEIVLQAGTLARLFSADRSEHVFAANGVIDRCKRGELVVSDRYALSSLVYQGIDCGDALPKALNEEFPAPETLFFFDIEPEAALKRMENRRIREIFEYLDFQVKARERYKALLPWREEKGTTTITIDAAKTPDAVAEDVWKALQNVSLFKALR
ncbi:MAG: dTMP kinase [Treponema sp.]|jgi:dTMP kinase|nr:dTMP kinase [Treponema sp.]